MRIVTTILAATYVANLRVCWRLVRLHNIILIFFSFNFISAFIKIAHLSHILHAHIRAVCFYTRKLADFMAAITNTHTKARCVNVYQLKTFISSKEE